MKFLTQFLGAVLLSVNVAFAAVNLNTATQAELETLKGVGPAKAKSIIEYREQNGAFQSVNDLKKVKGFGDKTVENLKGDLHVGEPEKGQIVPNPAIDVKPDDTKKGQIVPSNTEGVKPDNKAKK